MAVAGRYAADSDVLVKAVTDRGPGFWVMTPLATPGGWTVLVNRGFVPDEARSAARALPAAPAEVTGLLRMSQPKGAFLRRNRPDESRWYSRDTVAIAASLGLPAVAPYFIDADARPDGDLPIGGLTVVGFRNSHLGYALTWFALAALWAGWLGWLWRRGKAD
ncbi:SURF1 family cytochrome oxidase biogenesis protein [Paracoccus aminovorans]